MALSPTEELISINQILHLTHHRNKNQHRLAKWWKEFSLLRRNMAKLLTELETNLSYTTLSAKSKKTQESKQAVEKRAYFLADVLAPRCYQAFSRLVSDNQYAVLGLMLIGILAKTKEVVEPLRHQSSEHEGLEDKLHKNRDPIAAQDFGELLERSVTESNQQRDSGGRQSDILTEAINSGTEEAATILEESNASIQSKLTPVKRPRKKRKKGDVFDDLFDKLI